MMATVDQTAAPLPPNLRPRDAATLIIIDRSCPAARILMGRRSSRHAFMPGSYVFPGGRVDRADARMTVADDFAHGHMEKLLVDMKGGPSPRRARALALAAVRETWEEAGIMLGVASGAEVGGDLPDAWRSFGERRILPRLADLRFVGRAITPPRRPRRFDTRFFAVFAESIAYSAPAESRMTDELEDVCWLTFAEARQTNLPRVTLRMIDHLERRLQSDRALNGIASVPYYYTRRGRLFHSEI
jgi:8-oxo-dGTP pyrophosphatase MutT (NUDIX family)